MKALVCSAAWLVPLLLLGNVLICYLPQMYGFVGTDVSVYYEIGRRLAEDGKLSLWGNYWDHKPALIYLFFAPFTRLDRILGDTAGLKIGVLVAYALLSFLLYRVLMLGVRGTLNRVLALLGAVLFVGIALGWLDWVANGILMAAAIVLAFSGLLLISDGQGRRTALGAGVLVGLAPFFRPTALSVLPFFSLALLFEWRTGQRPRRWLWALSGLVLSAGVCSAWMASLGVHAIVEGLFRYNAAYGAQSRAATPILAFFRQDWLALGLAAALMSATLVMLGVDRKSFFRSRLIVFGWAVAEILSICYQRKLESFYVFGFLLPAIFACTHAAVHSGDKFKAPPLAMLLLFVALVSAANWRRVDPRIFRNPLISQRGQMTFSVAKTVADDPCRTAASTLLVYGNRAQIYTLAARFGVKPYAWTVFLNPITDPSLLAARRGEFEDRLHRDPPDYIAYAGGPGWTPNSAGRSAAVERLLAARYAEVEVPATSGVSFPYGYRYRLYRRAGCHADRSVPQITG